MKTGIIVIARTIENSADLVQAVEGLGFTPLVEPVLAIDYVDNGWPEIAAGRTLIFTSANGVRAFARKSDERDYLVYTVGRNTAEEARKCGFGLIESAEGTVEDLAELLLDAPQTALRSPIYIHGEDVSQDLPAILLQKGLKIEKFTGYKANSAQNLSINLLKALDDRAVRGIMFFSARGGRAFSELVEQYGRMRRLRATKALCLSESVLKSVSVLPFQQTLVADRPDRYGMMRLLEQISVSED